MITDAKWIKAPLDMESAVVIFRRSFSCKNKVTKGIIRISAIGMFDARINGKKIEGDVFAPGWTSYNKRVQYREYDITELLCKENTVEIELGRGWAIGSVGGKNNPFPYGITSPLAIAELEISDERGKQVIRTDESWKVFTSPVTFAEIYHGETVDMTAEEKLLGDAEEVEFETEIITTVGELIIENERLLPAELIKTPKGELVLDFGQNIAGYVEIKIRGKRGKRIVLHHAEVLDAEGNFYTENMRDARNEIVYVLSGAEDLFKPRFSFQGFRYVRITEYPFENVDLSAFSAIVVHSEMKRTGNFRCGNDKVNQLYHNIIWGQKGNFLDVPTDCPQRDERLGWTGDAQVFAKTAMINYNVKKFFAKWLGDMAAEQEESGEIHKIVPDSRKEGGSSAAWSDAACIIPWELYLAYGDKELLKSHFPMMKKWIDYLRSEDDNEYLWTSGKHYGDWLALDGNPDGLYGLTPNFFVASAFYAYSTSLLVKAGKELCEDMSEYKELLSNIHKEFRNRYIRNGRVRLVSDDWKEGDSEPIIETQTAYVLLLKFNLCEESEKPLFAKRLVELIREKGNCNVCGFVGTPYILHALSENGYTDVAYELLLREESPSWLYSVNCDATTMWEHWNGIKEDGSFWDPSMNSFNHYAYGAVFDWIFGVSLGIKPVKPGYREFEISPNPQKRLCFAEGELETKFGKIRIKWYYENEDICYDIEIPEVVTAKITLPGEESSILKGGKYNLRQKRRL